MKDFDGAPPSGGYDPFDLNPPHARWKRFRETQPMFHHADTGCRVVPRYDDIKAIFDDWKTFVGKPARTDAAKG